MRLIFYTFVLCLAITGFSTPSRALSLEQAQACAERLLNSYNQRVYPADLVSVTAITRRTFGNVFSMLNETDQQTAIEAVRDVLRDSFERPTGRYRYSELTITAVKPAQGGLNRAIGSVNIVSPKYTGPASFLALVQDDCRVEQVRIGDIYSLTISLGETLKQSRQWRNLLD